VQTAQNPAVMFSVPSASISKITGKRRAARATLMRL
jgi:hypothetical protein